MKSESQGDYQSPSLTVYGSAEALTGNQNAAGCDGSCEGAADDSYYSVGK